MSEHDPRHHGHQWQPAGEQPNHPLAALDGAEVGEQVRLAVEMATAPQRGARHFQAFLRSDELGQTRTPVLRGLCAEPTRGASGDAGLPWVQVTHFAGVVPVEGGEVEVPEGIDLLVIEALGGIVAPGGHLTMEYDTAFRRSTARALSQGVPPVATPMGGMMFSVGCGVAFTNRYATDGGASGPRSLQGFRALDPEHELRRGPQMLADLERFMDSSAELDWDLQVKCRPLAEATITVLRARLGVLAREFDVVAGSINGPTIPVIASNGARNTPPPEAVE